MWKSEPEVCRLFVEARDASRSSSVPIRVSALKTETVWAFNPAAPEIQMHTNGVQFLSKFYRSCYDLI